MSYGTYIYVKQHKHSTPKTYHSTPKTCSGRPLGSVPVAQQEQGQEARGDADMALWWCKDDAVGRGAGASGESSACSSASSGHKKVVSRCCVMLHACLYFTCLHARPCCMRMAAQ
jgi:hypothetical protein